MHNEYFILNKHAHYFVVNGSINQQNLQGCDLFRCLDDLLLEASKIGEVELDVVEDNVYSFIQDSDKNEWKLNNLNGFSLPVVTESIEHYLSNWSL